MTTYTWPVHKWVPQSSAFSIRTISQMSTSPFTGGTRASSLGQIWVCEATFPPMKNRDAYEFASFLEGLEGPVNPVRMHDWHRRQIRAFDGTNSMVTWTDGSGFTDGSFLSDPSWSLTTSIDAASGARSVTISGFPVSQACLYRGDAIGIGDNLLQVQNDIVSDGSGDALVPVLPGLRKAVVAGTPVITIRPKVLMRMAPDVDTTIFRAPVHSNEITLRFVEAVDLP